MNNQEAFTKSVLHCLAQEAASMHENNCVYAAPDGNACAIGCLLPRELGQQLDSLAWVTVCSSIELPALEARSLLKGVDSELLCELQGIHDKFEERDPETLVLMRSKFQKIAGRFGLEMPA